MNYVRTKILLDEGHEHLIQAYRYFDAKEYEECLTELAMMRAKAKLLISILRAEVKST